MFFHFSRTLIRQELILVLSQFCFNHFASVTSFDTAIDIDPQTLFYGKRFHVTIGRKRFHSDKKSIYFLEVHSSCRTKHPPMQHIKLLLPV